MGRVSVYSLVRSVLIIGFFALGCATATAACELAYCTIDLDFAKQNYVGCEDLKACIAANRATGKWAKWKDGHFTQFGVDEAAVTDLGIAIEPEAQNNLRYSRDLANPVWLKTKMLATKSATGVDNVSDAATTLTAVENDATVSQVPSLAPARANLSVFLRRRKGEGAISISYDGGTTWIPCLVQQVFQRCSAGISGAVDPNVVLKIHRAGDAIDVDFIQFESQLWPTSPILTSGFAPVKRGADRIEIREQALVPLNSGTFSVLIEGDGVAPRDRSATPVELIGGENGSVFSIPHLAKLVQLHHTKLKKNFFTHLGWGVSPLLAQGSMAKHFRIAASSNSSEGLSLVADGGPVFSESIGFDSSNLPWYLGDPTGSYSGIIQRITIWKTKLEDNILRSLSTVEIAVAVITDSSLPWKNLTVRDLINLNGSVYEVQSGINREPTTNTYPTQIRASDLVRFNLFPNNSWAIDSSDPFTGSDRVELSGNPYESNARFAGNEVASTWITDSFYIENGDPITTDWVTIGQIHDRWGGNGPILSFSLRTGEYLTVDVSERGTIGTFPIVRAHWYNRVINFKLNPSGDGYVGVWINGQQVANYHGPIGNKNTLYYYWKFGVYRSHAPEYTAVRYANVTIRQDDMSSKILNPDPIPPRYCDHGEKC
jgi:hypothetical protein